LRFGKWSRNPPLNAVGSLAVSGSSQQNSSQAYQFDWHGKTGQIKPDKSAALLDMPAIAG
jgi:hypothetical protein